MKPPFAWDAYSDQPALLTDRAYKKRMRKTQRLAFAKMLLTSLIIFPVALLVMPFLRGRAVNPQDFFGMGVSLERGEAQFALIQELGVRHVLVRLPLWELHKLPEYSAFVQRFTAQGCEVLINVLQDREHIEDAALLENNLRQIFSALAPYVKEFQIGNAINRSKWGFFSADEYLGFFQVAQQLRDTEFPQLQLLGPAVIDFEYHVTARALFNFKPVHFDRVSALLYVDRRGAPSKRQLGFNTKDKIALLYAMAKLSSAVRQPQTYITEVNWPLQQTAPYAPTSEKECVSPQDYAHFMRDYLLTALHSGKVARVYWHQLIAPGYGLVDNRAGQLSKYPAFAAFKALINKD